MVSTIGDFFIKSFITCREYNSRRFFCGKIDALHTETVSNLNIDLS